MSGILRIQAMVAALAERETWRMPVRFWGPVLDTARLVRPSGSRAGIHMHPYAPPLGTRAYGRYLAGLRRVGDGEAVPIMAHLSLTDQCPYSCARCSHIARAAQQPSLEDLRGAIDQLRAAGTSKIALTGGEPTCREDLCDILRECADFAPLLFTTGRGIGRERARALAEAGLESAFVSLDHYRPPMHDAGRGRGAFQAAIEAIVALRAAGVYVAAQAVVGSDLLAQGEMNEFLRFCTGLGVDEVMLLEAVDVTGRVPAAPLPDSARRELASIHVRAAADFGLPKVSAMSLLESGECMGCQAGLTFIYVDTAGDVFPCDFVPLSFGNIYRDGLPEIMARIRRLLKRPCRECLAWKVRAWGQGAPLPADWEATQRMLRDYEPGELPDWMKWIGSTERGTQDGAQ